MSALRAGLIGCGAIGSRYDEGRSTDSPRANAPLYTHAGMLSALPEFELVAIAEPDQQRRAACRTAWGVPTAYAGHREMLARERLDVLCLATPDETHAALLADILELARPCAIFTEKPLAATASEARALGLRCEAAGVALLVDHVRRCDSNHLALRDFLSGSGLGPLRTVVGHYVRGIRHNGCQLVNLLRFFVGEPLCVQAFGLAQGSVADDPSLDLRLVFADGCTALVAAQDRAGYAYSLFETEFYGDRGRLRLDATGRDISLELAEPYAEFPGFTRLAQAPSPWPKETYGAAMLRAGRELARAASGQPLELALGWREAARDLEIIEAALASALAGGAEIALPAPQGL